MSDDQPGQIRGEILIVDDDLPSQQALSTLLEDHGYEVRSAPDGPTALTMVQTDPPDLILLDVLMFEMDGFEVCRRLKAQPQTQDIPVLFISALGKTVDWVRGFDVGGVDFIAKPFRAEEVLARVDTHLVLRNAQRRLETQNAELRKLSQAIEQSANTVIITDAEGRIEYANPKFEETTGYTLAEAIGQNPRILKSGAHEEAYYRELWETITSGRIWRGEFCNKRKDGSLYWEQATVAPVCDEAGRVTNYVAIKEDIGERKRAEQALQESEALLNKSQTIAHMGSWELDLVSDRLTWSDEVYRMFGLRPKEFDATYEAFLDTVHPDDRVAVDAAYSASLREGRDTYEIEHRIVRRDNREVRVVHEKCEHVRDDSGRIVRSVGMVQDITERKKVEEALRHRLTELTALHQIAHTVASVTDLADALQAVAQTMSRLFEVSTVFINVWNDGQTEVVAWFDRETGRSDLVGQVLPMADAVAIRRPLSRGQAVSIPDIQVYSLPVDLDRHLRVRNLRALLLAPLRVRGTPFGTLALATTQAGRVFAPAEVELAETIAADVAAAIENTRLYEQAAQVAVAEERTRLARDLHDSVTQTLYSVALMAEALPRVWEQHPDEARKALDNMHRLARGALGEMRTLLLELRPAILLEKDLGELLCQLADATMGRTQTTVETKVRGERPLPDEVRVALYRIVQEALNNVVKHAAASRAIVELDLQPGQVVLCIHDDGRGFDPQAVPGHGFGVRNMAYRAKAIGAEFHLESWPGHGTQIEFVWQERAAG